MAYKKRYKMTRKKRGRKKFSLNDRIKYHEGIVSSFYKKFENEKGDLKVPVSVVAKAQEKDKRYLFSSGFVQAARRGLTMNYDECPKANKAGQDAGKKAREKAADLKF